jgi:hypothetical protein
MTVMMVAFTFLAFALISRAAGRRWEFTRRRRRGPTHVGVCGD